MLANVVTSKPASCLQCSRKLHKQTRSRVFAHTCSHTDERHARLSCISLCQETSWKLASACAQTWITQICAVSECRVTLQMCARSLSMNLLETHQRNDPEFLRCGLQRVCVFVSVCVVFSRGLQGFSRASCHYYLCLFAPFDRAFCKQGCLCVCIWVLTSVCVCVCTVWGHGRPDAMYQCTDQQWLFCQAPLLPFVLLLLPSPWFFF